MVEKDPRGNQVKEITIKRGVYQQGAKPPFADNKLSTNAHPPYKSPFNRPTSSQKKYTHPTTNGHFKGSHVHYEEK